MNVQLHFTAAILILNIFCWLSYGIYLPDEKFMNDGLKERSAEIGLVNDGARLAISNQNEFSNPINNVIVQESERDIDPKDETQTQSKLSHDVGNAEKTVITAPNNFEIPSSTNLAAIQNSVVESSEEMAARLGSSIELMKGQLFMQPGYHVIDVHTQEPHADFPQPQTTTLISELASTDRPPESTAPIDSISPISSDRPKIAETIPKKTNFISDSHGAENERDVKMKSSIRDPIPAVDGNSDSENAGNKPSSIHFADCASGEHDEHEHGKIPPAELEGSSSERIYSKISTNLMESTKTVSDIPAVGGIKFRTSDLTANPKVDTSNSNNEPINQVSNDSSSSTPSKVVGQKEFVLTGFENDATTSAESETALLSLEAARSLATNMMTLLIRYDERQCPAGEAQCARPNSDSPITESINATEYQHVVLPDDDSGKKADVANDKHKSKANVSDEQVIDQRATKERELSLLEKIILGIRCARQDCRGVLNGHHVSSDHSSQHQPKKEGKRRPVSTNWTIMRMKRFRHQILDDRRKHGENVSANFTGTKPTPEKAGGELHRNPDSGDIMADVTHLLNALVSCECQVSRLQRNFLRRMMFDDVGRARVIDALKNFINGGQR